MPKDSIADYKEIIPKYLADLDLREAGWDNQSVFLKEDGKLIFYGETSNDYLILQETPFTFNQGEKVLN